MTRATLGFIFTSDFTQVLLITKNRPSWQVGKINGLGGKCEGDEAFEECISREVSEEAAISISATDWRKVASLSWKEWKVLVMASVWLGSTTEVQSLTDEPIAWYEVKNLPLNCMSNLTWLIPLAVDALKKEELQSVIVQYT